MPVGPSLLGNLTGFTQLSAFSQQVLRVGVQNDGWPSPPLPHPPPTNGRPAWERLAYQLARRQIFGSGE